MGIAVSNAYCNQSVTVLVAGSSVKAYAAIMRTLLHWWVGGDVAMHQFSCGAVWVQIHAAYSFIRDAYHLSPMLSLICYILFSVPRDACTRKEGAQAVCYATHQEHEYVIASVKLHAGDVVSACA